MGHWTKSGRWISTYAAAVKRERTAMRKRWRERGMWHRSDKKPPKPKTYRRKSRTGFTFLGKPRRGFRGYRKY